MQEFVKKLIERLEEKRFNADLECASWKNKAGTLFKCADERRMAYIDAIEIVNQLAEEYNNDFCEWKQEDEEGFSNCRFNYQEIISDEVSGFVYCPYCGKKIKIAPYQPKGE